MSSALLNINGEVKNYRIGDGLKDSDYILVAVDWNSVIIADANDKETIISMPDAMILDQSKMLAGGVSNQRLPNNSLLPTAPQALQETPSEPAVETSESSPQSAIEEAVTALQENPASYLSRMG